MSSMPAWATRVTQYPKRKVTQFFFSCELLPFYVLKECTLKSSMNVLLFYSLKLWVVFMCSIVNFT